MRIIPFAAADTLLDGALTAEFQGDYTSVLYIDGALELDGPFLAALGARIDLAGVELVAVAGDLTVAGPIELYQYHPSLYVGGFTRAETLEGGDCEIVVGDGAFTYLVYGYYNDGILRTGAVEVPWVINSDHDLDVDAPAARFVDNFGVDEDADYDARSIAGAFLPELLDPDGASLNVGSFLARLRAGGPVLRDT
ncbi:hypothetical protein Val02_00550 [Virgisporangium aliadipatigenens]|uniref:Uncharacterized protein n=1 Tax=Virgisporangium aliadipatigenens TaxID=741659 RepID=A0A8J3YDK9_9ACTN|nr:hypothetical protein [Virgisporangium aliadipatigenens]GIJ43169.1 hypothetical protein Val02_00550 [Virgisporangium aliadipatigenens]